MRKVVQFLRNCRRISSLVLAGEVLVNAKPIVLNEPPIQTLPVASDFDQKSVLKNASSVAVDAVCSLLNQTAIALGEAEEVYATRIEEVIEATEYVCKLLGKLGESYAWDKLLEARSNLEEAKRKRQNLLLLTSSVEQAVDSIAVTAFQADAEYAGITAGERLVSVKSFLKPLQERSASAEKRLSATEVKSIEVTSQYFEKLKKKQTAEQEEEQGIVGSDSKSKTHQEDHELLGTYDEGDGKN